MTSDSWVKKISFILAIIILFVSVIQVGLSTFWPDPEYQYLGKDCYRYVDGNPNPDQECLNEQKTIEDNYNQERKTQHNIKFIVGTVLSLITILLVLFISFNDNIIYGLFGGGVINQLWTLRFVENQNIIGFIALLILFVIVIFFVQRKSKK